MVRQKHHDDVFADAFTNRGRWLNSNVVETLHSQVFDSWQTTKQEVTSLNNVKRTKGRVTSRR